MLNLLLIYWVWVVQLVFAEKFGKDCGDNHYKIISVDVLDNIKLIMLLLLNYRNKIAIMCWYLIQTNESTFVLCIIYLLRTRSIQNLIIQLNKSKPVHVKSIYSEVDEETPN